MSGVPGPLKVKPSSEKVVEWGVATSEVSESPFTVWRSRNDWVPKCEHHPTLVSPL